MRVVLRDLSGRELDSRDVSLPLAVLLARWSVLEASLRGKAKLASHENQVMWLEDVFVWQALKGLLVGLDRGPKELSSKELERLNEAH